MAFVARLKQPDRSNKYYRSPNPFETGSEYSMWNGGNCTAYAWGRFHEAMGGSVTDKSGYWLPTYNAEDWWGSVKGYSKGKTPRLGAVLCLSDGPYSGCGHVAVVEQINSDGSIVTSESGWKSYIWTTKTRRPPDYNGVGYGFQGFIYNTTVKAGELGVAAGNYIDAPEVFLTEARKHIGPQGHAWVQSMTSIGGGAWCAATICAIAKAVGFAGKCLPASEYYVDGVATDAIDKGGTYIPGPRKFKFGGKPVTPQPGDLILFDWYGSYLNSKYGAHHIGVVEKVSGNTIGTIEGNAGGTYKRRQYAINSNVIAYYTRPNWSLVGGAYVTNMYGAFQSLYSTKSTNADATLRHVGYLDVKTGNFTSKKTKFGLTAINYTRLLGPLVDALGGVGGSTGGSGTIDTSGITNTTARGVADYLASKGLNRAGIAGIMGNIEAESSFRLDAVELGYPYQGRGLCQWSWGRREKLLREVPDWQHNLKGQMDFLWNELSTSYNSSTLTPIQQVEDTESGCYEATKIFVMNFEVPAGYNESWMWDARYKRSLKYYNQMKVVYNYAGVSVNNLTPKKTVSIPSSLPQTGIVSDYTYYIRNWAYAPAVLYKEWQAAGSKSDNNIATIHGHYIVAVKPKFGTVGDLLQVVLSNGKSFTAVMGDTKGSDAPSEWGHTMGGAISIIEWEAVANSVSQLNKSLKNLGWYGAKVTSISNYGNYKSIQMAGNNLPKVDQWIRKWPEGSRYPYPGSNRDWLPGETGPGFNKYNEAQCLAYAREFLRFLNGKTYSKQTEISASLTPANVVKYLKGVQAGTHLRFYSPYKNHTHSISLLSVTDTRVKLGDCNWNHDNKVHYYDLSLQGFCNEFGGWSRYLGYIETP